MTERSLTWIHSERTKFFSLKQPPKERVKFLSFRETKTASDGVRGGERELELEIEGEDVVSKVWTPTLPGSDSGRLGMDNFSSSPPSRSVVTVLSVLVVSWESIA